MNNLKQRIFDLPPNLQKLILYKSNIYDWNIKRLEKYLKNNLITKNEYNNIIVKYYYPLIWNNAPPYPKLRFGGPKIRSKKLRQYHLEQIKKNPFKLKRLLDLYFHFENSLSKHFKVLVLLKKLYNIKHSITRNSFANSRKFILNKINNRRLTNSQYMNILKYFNKNNLRCISI